VKVAEGRVSVWTDGVRFRLWVEPSPFRGVSVALTPSQALRLAGRLARWAWKHRKART
jgi:hypothetical protein